MTKKIDIECQHFDSEHKDSVYVYSIINGLLLLCLKCEAKLRKQVLEQKEIEDSIK